MTNNHQCSGITLRVYLTYLFYATGLHDQWVLSLL